METPIALARATVATVTQLIRRRCARRGEFLTHDPAHDALHDSFPGLFEAFIAAG